jgi:hypothetical protein
MILAAWQGTPEGKAEGHRATPGSNGFMLYSEGWKFPCSQHN